MAAVTVQNEPHFSPATYPGMVRSPAQEAEFVGRHLGPAAPGAVHHALIVLNSAGEPRSFGVRCPHDSFSYRLPAGAVATFTWE